MKDPPTETPLGGLDTMIPVETPLAPLPMWETPHRRSPTSTEEFDIATPEQGGVTPPVVRGPAARKEWDGNKYRNKKEKVTWRADASAAVDKKWNKLGLGQDTFSGIQIVETMKGAIEASLDTECSGEDALWVCSDPNKPMCLRVARRNEETDQIIMCNVCGKPPGTDEGTFG